MDTRQTLREQESNESTRHRRETKEVVYDYYRSRTPTYDEPHQVSLMKRWINTTFTKGTQKPKR